MRDACLAFGTPVSGGNVSLYNQNPRGAIDPTPTIGMVGLLEGRAPVTSHFKKAGDAIFLLGENGDELGGSEYLKTLFGVKAGRVPRLDLGRAKALVDLLQALAARGLLESAHDCAEGGLAVALAESCITALGRETGAEVRLAAGGLSPEALLFGESQSRVVVSVDPKNTKSAREVIESFRYPYQEIGTVGGDRLSVDGLLRIPTKVLTHTWRDSIRRRMEAR
jgi:phosphoribosylformylglycinamidine synthase